MLCVEPGPPIPESATYAKAIRKLLCGVVVARAPSEGGGGGLVGKMGFRAGPFVMLFWQPWLWLCLRFSMS